VTGVTVVGVRGHVVAVEAHAGRDSAILSALMMAGTKEPGLGEGYDSVACGAGWQVPHYAKSVG
jgi:hypothetical protein